MKIMANYNNPYQSTKQQAFGATINTKSFVDFVESVPNSDIGKYQKVIEELTDAKLEYLPKIKDLVTSDGVHPRISIVRKETGTDNYIGAEHYTHLMEAQYSDSIKTTSPIYNNEQLNTEYIMNKIEKVVSQIENNINYIKQKLIKSLSVFDESNVKPS